MTPTEQANLETARRYLHSIEEQAGDGLSRFAVFLQLRDGKIAAQRNYDCFEPW